jgi:hypothetical protein
MTDEPANKPKVDGNVVALEQPLPAELDEEEAEFRALRLDLPGVKGAGDVGLTAIRVGKKPSPDNEFYRTHPDFRPVVPMLSIEVGMDRHYIAVAPNMVEPLASIGITVTNHTLYLIITPRGALQIIPVAGPNQDGEQHEASRTREAALIDGIDGWHRMYWDKESGIYRSFPAPDGRYGDPNWPTPLKPAKIFRRGFRDKGRLIDHTDHIIFQKWAERDRD